ncbi:MAG: hypothetical protein FWC27_13250 [Firmicutes bacterium]|nr:hypothetical protein [Bacillota bacterium]
MNKPTIGQTVYIANMQKKDSDELVPWIVTKVGRKYYTVSRQGCSAAHGIQFCIENNCEKADFGTCRVAYFSEQDFYDEQEYQRRFRQLHKCFEWHRSVELSLGQLRQACRALGLDNGEPDKTEERGKPT